MDHFTTVHTSLTMSRARGRKMQTPAKPAARTYQAPKMDGTRSVGEPTTLATAFERGLESWLEASALEMPRLPRVALL